MVLCRTLFLVPQGPATLGVSAGAGISLVYKLAMTITSLRGAETNRGGE